VLELICGRLRAIPFKRDPTVDMANIVIHSVCTKAIRCNG
jgi:hypothetical protein